MGPNMIPELLQGYLEAFAQVFLELFKHLGRHHLMSLVNAKSEPLAICGRRVTLFGEVNVPGTLAIATCGPGQVENDLSTIDRAISIRLGLLRPGEVAPSAEAGCRKVVLPAAIHDRL